MSIPILMPALSPTMEEGKLAKWLVKEGDEVRSGDILAEIETDKATMEFEAVDEGRIGKILIPEGTEGVKVNQPIAELVQDGEAAAKAESAAVSQPQPPPQPADKPTAAERPKEEKPKVAKPEIAREPSAVAIPENAVPAGTEFVTITVREALRDAFG